MKEQVGADQECFSPEIFDFFESRFEFSGGGCAHYVQLQI
jgi:hypothetical protein